MLTTLYINEINLSPAVLWISGSDAFSYLQGQFSQDLRQPKGLVGYGLWLNEKGRVLADSYILRLSDNVFRVIGLNGLGPVALGGLISRNIIADDVELKDQTMDYAVIQLVGVGAAAACEIVVGRAPEVGLFLVQEDTYIFRSRPSAMENFIFLVPVAAVAAWRARLQAAGARLVDADTLRRERILAGQVAVPEELGPSDLPNEGGLEDIAVSYTKGCYLGQEVTNRLKNLGQVRRRLHIVRGSGPLPTVLPGALHQNGRRIGELRSVVADGEYFVGMAMLTLLNLEAAQGVSLAPDGPPGIRIVRPV